MSETGSTRSVGPNGAARAHVFQVRVRRVDYDPPKLHASFAEIVTYACGQLMRSPPTADTGGVADEEEEDTGDDLVPSIRLLFCGYIEFNTQVSPLQLQKWLLVEALDADASDFESKSVYLKDREQHIRVRSDPETRYRSKLDLIARPVWTVGKAERGGQGARTDMEEIRELLRTHGPEEGIRLVGEKFPGQFIRYANGITQLAQVVIPKVREEESFQLRPWQAAMMRILTGKAHDRHIYWIEDAAGGAGKSRFTTFLCREKGAIELDGRMMDAAFAYTGQPIVLFDLARPTDVGTLKDLYSCGEKLKNGQIYSSKYQSRLKVFKVPHVIYFSNSPPPVGVWSADRLQHIVLSEPIPFQAGSGELAAEEPPEPTGAEAFKEFLEAEKKNRKRQREELSAEADA